MQNLRRYSLPDAVHLLDLESECLFKFCSLDASLLFGVLVLLLGILGSTRGSRK